MRDKTNIWRPLEVHRRAIVSSEATDSTCTFDAKFQLHWLPQEFNWLRVTHSPRGHCSSLGFSQHVLDPALLSTLHIIQLYTKRNPHLWTYVAV